MIRFNAVLLVAFLWAVCLPSTTAVAQQPAPQPTPAQMGQMVQQAVPVEAVLGYLAFIQNVNNDRLVKARSSLAATFETRGALIQEARDGATNVRKLQGDIRALQTDMVADLVQILTKDQGDALRQAMGMTPPAQQDTTTPGK